MKKENPLFFLFSKIKWPKSLFIIAIIISSIGSITEIIVPLLTGNLIDLLVKQTLELKFIVFLILMFLLDAIFSGLGLFLLIKVGEKIIYSIRSILWKHILFLNTSFFDKNESGQLISRITDDTSLINNFISQKLPAIIPSFITLIGSITMLFIMDWKMTLLTFIIIPIFLMVIIPLGNIIEKLSFKTQQKVADFTGTIGRVISAIRLVKISTNEEFELNNTKEKLSSIYKLNIKHAKIIAILQPFTSILLLVMIGIILSYGGYRIAVGAITSGTLVSMIFYVIQLSSPISEISTLITEYKSSKGASKRIYGILNEPVEENKVNLENIPQNKELIFNSVYFSYDSKNVLENVSFAVPINKKTAIVGPSGSGKSTILNLISRLYKADSGGIYYGGHSIYDIDLKKWRIKLGYVMQNNIMMNGSIRDNILYGVSNNISDDELEYYSILANSHDFISNLPHQYDSQIGESGIKLSGGQKQRINIARNLIKNPDILLLDEATASLDSESEKKIQNALNNLFQNRTTIIIAHRLSTIKNADQIIFLDNGKITGIGTHDYLIKNHNKYNTFVSNQSIN
ncbi:ABC transporter ATP-binding protein [Staphylococcus epidermidis]|uniref:ABC transporter ATP-binding protein n=1 Tax=Staphylococcus epidermidis TaxID=1282 RepID=UPI00103D995B|nr:ABC transporter ATP-binding protein [Staphylococcus epidermidis]MCA0116995.1 ABC transporter ATP-binding protein/permease [Staphylococcus epidermidis]TBW82645.1 ABC transporter ATP-binding protein [Staphylococcus epidermidis]BEI31584.1 antibiotic ABC transporter ATP-binding protein [Staphylococcus epidermidis]